MTGPLPRTSRLWFHVQGWHNLLLQIGDIAADEWKAAQIPDDSPRYDAAQKKLCQFVWSKPYVPPRTDESELIDAKELWQRQLPLPRGKCPADTLFLVTGVDLGTRISWYTTLAVRANGMLHVVDYDSFEIPSEKFNIDRAYVIALNQLWDYLSAGYITEDGRTLVPRQMWIDAGNKPKGVLDFVRMKNKDGRRGTIFACIGRGQSQMDRSNYIAPKKTGNQVREIDQDGTMAFVIRSIQRSWEITCNADEFKLAVQSAITCELGNPGAMTLFAGTQKTHYRITAHWTNEQRRIEWDPKRGFVKVWHKKGQNHLLDATAYAYGAAIRCGFSPIKNIEGIKTNENIESSMPGHQPAVPSQKTSRIGMKNNGW